MDYLVSLTPKLEEIAQKVETILSNNFIGFYVSGSLTMGAWNPETSDIDFLVITEQPTSQAENLALQKVHEEIVGDSVARKLEGEYISLNDLQEMNFSIITPTVKEGVFVADNQCQLSADNVLCLIETGKVISGKPIQDLGLSVSGEQFKDAVYQMLQEDLEEVETANNFKDRLYLLVNALRSIYSLRTGKLPTKISAVESAENILGGTLKENIIEYWKDKSKEFDISKEKLQEVYKYGLSLKS